MRVPLLAAAAVTAALALAGCANGTPRNSAGVVTAPASVNPYQVTLGDCTGPITEGDVNSLKVVPCTESHNYEAFAQTSLTDEAYPGDPEVQKKASSFCTGEFRTFIGLSTKDSAYDQFFLYPTDASWATGDRAVMCLVGLEKGGIKGSLKGVAK